jgi:excinuclease ABC subunit A
MQDTITIRGARLHNLKNITLSIPKNKLVVLTGLSGSGKSTLAFDTLHQEAIRQYLESVGMVTYQQKPSVERIEGLSPSISIDQHLTNHSPRSTVGTVTEVFTYLRVLFARIGQQPCPTCGRDVPPSHNVTGLELWDEDSADGPAEAAENTYPCPHCGAGVPELGMAHFSFNKPEGACPTCTGLGVVYGANLSMLIDPARSIPEGGVVRWVSQEMKRHLETLQLAAKHFGFDFNPDTPIGDFTQAQRDLLLYGVHSPQFRRHYPQTEPPQNVNQGRFEGIVSTLMRRYQEHAQDADYRERMEQLMVSQTCPDCEGNRLRPESRRVTVAGLTIIDLSQIPFTALQTWIERLPGVVSSRSPERSERERNVIQPIIDDLSERIRRLVNVGAGYLTLERASPTLSMGEAQRLRLAALLGSDLTGVMYVFDEPTVGLHQRDTGRLIDVLRQLRDLGNTVIVVEHDLDVIRAADHVIDFGPGAGQHGGYIVAEGAPGEIAATASSITGDYLAGRVITPGSRTRPGSGKHLVIRGAREHNLKNITVQIPLGTLTAVTGVSGSGKSSLMLDILDPAARQHFNGATEAPGEHDSIEGWEHLDKIISIDQAAIMRSSRSNAATYTDAFTPIRQVFAETTEARHRHLTPGHFSFNVPGGHCERCKGAGTLTVNMHFLPDVQVRCPACQGRRFKPEVLAVRYRGYDIAEILDLTIEEALTVFQAVPAVAARLSLMSDVGLGYLQLGQPANTLSGGEAQRIKLAKELARRTTGRTLYLLDEPTTGLHPADVARLLDLLQRLVDGGNTVVIIEHHVDVIRASDWIIDLGPEGGEAGGYVVAEGTPEAIAGVAASLTGRFLNRALEGAAT